MSKQKFMEREFHFEGVAWFDLTGVRELDENRKVVIELVTQGYAGHYTALLVRVVGKNTGEIVRKVFRFKDHLREALYKDQPHPNYRAGMGLEVIGYCGWHWYIAVPSSTALLVDKVERWVEMFK